MTNTQRDELLISLAKGFNNFQNSFNDFRIEVKAEFNRIENKFDKKFDTLSETVKHNSEKIDTLSETVKHNSEKIDALVKDNKYIHEKITILTKDVSEIKQYTKENIEAISEAFRDIVKFNSQTTKHLEKHDKEISELQSKLA